MKASLALLTTLVVSLLASPVSADPFGNWPGHHNGNGGAVNQLSRESRQLLQAVQWSPLRPQVKGAVFQFANEVRNLDNCVDQFNGPWGRGLDNGDFGRPNPFPGNSGPFPGGTNPFPGCPFPGNPYPGGPNNPYPNPNPYPGNFPGNYGIPFQCRASLNQVRNSFYPVARFLNGVGYGLPQVYTAYQRVQRTLNSIY